jgi:hypothetical protein
VKTFKKKFKLKYRTREQIYFINYTQVVLKLRDVLMLFQKILILCEVLLNVTIIKIDNLQINETYNLLKKFSPQNIISKAI